MNKFYLYLFISCTFFSSIVIQTTLLSPHNAGVFYIDYSLVSVIFISLFPEISGLILFAFFSGYTIDVLSAADLGVYTLSRLTLYTFLRLLITKIYSDNFFVKFGIVLLSIIYERIFVFLAGSTGSMAEVDFHSVFTVKNILINAVAGYIFFLMLKEIYERIKA